MAPPILSVIKFQGTGNVQIFPLNTSVSPATLGTQDGADVSTTLEPTQTALRNGNNRVIDAFGKRYCIHGIGDDAQIFESGSGTFEGEWVSVYTVELGTGNGGSVHSGLHLLHPDGIPTLACMSHNNSNGTCYLDVSTDGQNWIRTALFGLGAIIAHCGPAVVYGDKLCWPVRTTSRGSTVVIWDLRLDIGFDSNHSTQSIYNGKVHELHVHQNRLFALGTNTSGNAELTVWNGGSGWSVITNTWDGQTLSVNNNGLGHCLFSDDLNPTEESDLIAMFSSSTGKRAFRILDPLGSAVTQEITSPVLDNITHNYPAGYTKYVDVDTDPLSPTVYVWYNGGDFNTGQYDLYQYNGIGSAMTLVSLGTNIPANTFGVVHGGVGSANRTPTEGARPELDGLPVEVGNGRTKYFFRMYGDPVGTAPEVSAALYFNVNSGPPDTLATLVPGSLVVESGSPSSTPIISATGDSIDDITPDGGVALYSFEVESDLDGVGEGQPYTLLMDIL